MKNSRMLLLSDIKQLRVCLECAEMSETRETLEIQLKSKLQEDQNRIVFFWF